MRTYNKKTVKKAASKRTYNKKPEKLIIKEVKEVENPLVKPKKKESKKD